jgi:hypothetical protein
VLLVQVLKVLWVHRVLKEILVAVVELVLKVTQEIQVLKVHKVLLDLTQPSPQVQY